MVGAADYAGLVGAVEVDPGLVGLHRRGPNIVGRQADLRNAVDAEEIAVVMPSGHFLVNESRGSGQFGDGAGVVIPVGVECCLSEIQNLQVGNGGGFIGGHLRARLPGAAGREKLREDQQKTNQEEAFRSHRLSLARLPGRGKLTRPETEYGLCVRYLSKNLPWPPLAQGS